MDEEFWRAKWRANQHGWDQSRPHPMLVRRLPSLGLATGARVFVPLCGKTLDIHWLLGQGFHVAGVEIVETAVAQLFADLGVEPAIRPAGSLTRHSGQGIDVFVGDVFAVRAEDLGAVDAIYDRAALVALPPGMRGPYAQQLRALGADAPQLLVTFDYDQSLMDGPPFSIPEAEVRTLYADAYEIDALDEAAVDGGLKGFCPAKETLWRLRPLGEGSRETTDARYSDKS